MDYNKVPSKNQIAVPWFRTRWFRFTLTAVGIVAVILIVLFNRQIGNLLKFFGSKAAFETNPITLDGANSTAPGYFLANGYTDEKWDPASGNWVAGNAVMVDPTDNSLRIKP